MLPLLPACSGCDTGAVTSSAGRIVFDGAPTDIDDPSERALYAQDGMVAETPTI
jgi:hypothetical protein